MSKMILLLQIQVWNFAQWKVLTVTIGFFKNKRGYKHEGHCTKNEAFH